MTYVSYANQSSTSRANPRFQLHFRARVKHDPSPGWNKECADMPHARRNIELAIPRAMQDVHAWFANWDKTGIRHTHENQTIVWPSKRPKALEDLVAEGLFRSSIPDSQKLVDNGWDPSLRLKAVPPGPAEKPNFKPTRVYISNPDGTISEGTLDDIAKGDEVVASAEVEGWWGSKDSSGYTYRADEILVYKGNVRPKECSLRSLSGDGPIVKRARTDPETTTELTENGSNDTSDASAEAAAPPTPGLFGVNEQEGSGNDGALSEEDDF
jgi:hypothetical protein